MIHTTFRSLLAASLFVFASCSEGGGGGRDPASISMTIGLEGGVLEETIPSSPLFGVRLEVPAGAVAADTDFVIREVFATTVSAPNATATGLIVEVEPDGLAFGVPATLALPYDEPSGAVAISESSLVPFTSQSGGERWTSCVLLSRDTASNLVQCSIEHLSLFTTGSWPRLADSPVRVHVDPESAALHLFAPGEYDLARDTILRAFRAGTGAYPAAPPWSDLTETCLGWTYPDAAARADADVVIQWRRFHELPLLASVADSVWAVTSAGLLPADGCGRRRARFTITFNESLLLPLFGEWQLEPTTATFTGVDLFTAAAHEYAHALGLPPECHGGGASCVEIPTDPTSIIHPRLAPGDTHWVVTPEDRTFFESQHPIEFHELTPDGTATVLQSATISFRVRSLCGIAALDESALALDIAGDGLSRHVGASALSVTEVSASELVVSYTPTDPWAGGAVCATAHAGTQGGAIDRTTWTFDVFGPPPEALFTGTPLSGVTPLAVHFTDQSTGEVSSRVWTFGDGTSSTVANPTHTYTAVGNYSVTLSVSGEAGSDALTKPNYVHVTPPSGTNCSGGGVDLLVTELNGGAHLRIRWCTGQNVLDDGGQFWTLQAESGDFCGWSDLFLAHEPTFDDVVGNGLGSNYCLRVVVTAEEPSHGDCITGILASDRDGPGCD